MIKTYRGANLDLEFYKGKATVDYAIEVWNDDDTEFDFSIYASLVCRVFYRKNGEFIFSPTIANAPGSNIVTLGVTMVQSALLQTREYYVEAYGVYPTTAEEELITYGIFKVK